jgi:hypothetical protein
VEKFIPIPGDPLRVICVEKTSFSGEPTNRTNEGGSMAGKTSYLASCNKITYRKQDAGFDGDLSL